MGSLCLESLWELSESEESDDEEALADVPAIDLERPGRRRVFKILSSDDRKFVPPVKDLDEQLKDDELMYRELQAERKATGSDAMVDDGEWTLHSMKVHWISFHSFFFFVFPLEQRQWMTFGCETILLGSSVGCERFSRTVTWIAGFSTVEEGCLWS